MHCRNLSIALSAAMLTINTVKNATAACPRSEAFRQAQLKPIDEPATPGSAHPAIRVPFILIGSWQKKGRPPLGGRPFPSAMKAALGSQLAQIFD